MDLRNATPQGHTRRQNLRLDPEQLVRLAEALPRHERKLIVVCRPKWDFVRVNGTDPTYAPIAPGVRVNLLSPAA
ncbi:MAG: hypothetical protein AAGA29_05970 [Planctomycetota bacterium]